MYKLLQKKLKMVVDNMRVASMTDKFMEKVQTPTHTRYTE